MCQAKVTVTNPSGIHARPATALVQMANRYKSRIFLERGSEKINAKSIIGVMSLGATYQTELTLSAEGEDEEMAVSALQELFENRFEKE